MIKSLLRWLSVNRWFALVTVTIVFVVYWSLIRPTFIRLQCHEEGNRGMEYELSMSEKAGTLDEYSIDYWSQRNEGGYKYCLRSRGL
jgi:hypothetical protein